MSIAMASPGAGGQGGKGAPKLEKTNETLTPKRSVPRDHDLEAKRAEIPRPRRASPNVRSGDGGFARRPGHGRSRLIQRRRRRSMSRNEATAERSTRTVGFDGNEVNASACLSA